MNRAMLSGVSGLKAHQSKMDVIGNNIANVNTYGYKSQRAVFSDIYYQTLRNASGGNASRGGINPSSVGYGSMLAGIQSQMTQSSMQNTGFGLDVAITGEGFLQVMDSSGNIFYTKAGMLDYDSNGYLTDINGNFVLGSTSVDGKPGTQKIRLDNIGSVSAERPTVTEEINGVKYTITASNASKYGNVALSVTSSEQLPAGQKAQATISNTGAILVQLNAFETFNSMADLNSAVNAAIKEANGGKEHAAGTFSITADVNKFGKDAVSGTWTGSALADKGMIEAPADFFDGGFSIKSFNLSKTITDGTGNFTITRNDVAGGTEYNVKTNIDGVEYSATFKGDIADKATLELKSATGVTPAGSITLQVADKNKLNTVLGKIANASSTADDATTSAPKFLLGGAKISSVSNNFGGQGPMTFTYALAPDGKMTITAKVGDKDYISEEFPITTGGTIKLKTTGDENVDGSITMTVPSKDQMLTNFGIDKAAADVDTQLANKLNASLGLHDYSGIKAQAAVSGGLTGAQIANSNFGVTSGTLQGMDKGAFGGGMTFMKTSTDFTGSGSLNSFVAEYQADADGSNPLWKVALNINGTEYTADISEGTASSSVLLKSAAGDYVQMTNPGFDGITKHFEAANPSIVPTPGSTVPALTGDTSKIVATPSTPSKDLGFGSVNFTLAGGTEGGPITLDQLTSVAIASDGSVTVSHPDKGTVVAGKISLANFANPSGLQQAGTNYYVSTANSGDPKLCDPGSGGSGSLKNSALEMSNVDLSAEFADMITTQRGFQANSRIITVSDSMLEELINLKR